MPFLITPTPASSLNWFPDVSERLPTVGVCSSRSEERLVYFEHNVGTTWFFQPWREKYGPHICQILGSCREPRKVPPIRRNTPQRRHPEADMSLAWFYEWSTPHGSVQKLHGAASPRRCHHSLSLLKLVIDFENLFFLGWERQPRRGSELVWQRPCPRAQEHRYNTWIGQSWMAIIKRPHALARNFVKARMDLERILVKF